MATSQTAQAVAPLAQKVELPEMVCVVYPDSLKTRTSQKGNPYTVLEVTIKLRGAKADHAVRLFPPDGVKQVQPGVYTLHLGKSFEYRNNNLQLNAFHIAKRVCSLEDIGIDPDLYTP